LDGDAVKRIEVYLRAEDISTEAEETEEENVS
jgi:hypothetical protein